MTDNNTESAMEAYYESTREKAQDAITGAFVEFVAARKQGGEYPIQILEDLDDIILEARKEVYQILANLK